MTSWPRPEPYHWLQRRLCLGQYRETRQKLPILVTPGQAETVPHETAPMPARDGLEPGPGAEPTPAAEAPEANPLCAVADAAFSRREGTNFLDHCWRRVRRRRAPDASGLGPRPPRPSARRRRQALCETEWQQSRALARCHRQGRSPGTMAGRFAGTGIPAVKSFPHRAPSSVIGEERFGSRYDMEPAAQHGSSPDSPLQGAGFEPPVPRRAARRCSARKRRQCEVARTSPPSRHDYRASRSRASWVTTDARATRRRDQ